MTQRISNGGLIAIHNQMESWKNQGNALFYLQIRKIREFYNNNGVRIQSLLNHQAVIFETFYEMEEVKGVKQVVWEGEGKDRKPKLREGCTEQEWKDAVKEFQDEETIVNL
jgi:hypothetical protein